MFKKNKKGYCEFEEFKRFKGLIHGFSTRGFGDCNPKGEPENWKNIENFLAVLGLKKENLILAEQVHGNKIKVIRNEDKGKIIPEVDGLLTTQRGLVLGVKSADCLPILFFESEVQIVGVAHAGWRGVLARLPQKMVDQMIRMGGLPERVLVAIGPHICSKCYLVEKSRSTKFLSEFGKLEGMVKTKSNGDCLDLLVPTENQLRHSGVLVKNILKSGVCTSCQNKEFFSYQKDAKQTYGEMLGVIGLK